MQRIGQSPESFEINFRRLILVRVSVFLGGLTVVGTLLRHFVSPMPMRILVTNAVVALAFGLAPVVRHRRPELMVWTFLTGFLILVGHGGLIAGGINAPICLLLPLIPVMGFCFGGQKTGAVSLIMALFLTAGLVIAEKLGLSQPVLDPANISMQRAANLAVIVTASYAIGYVYETLRKRSEQRIVEFSRLASLGTMAGGIAHEINNPLAIIMGYAEQIDHTSRTGNLDPERQIMISEKLKTTCNRIAKVVAALRSYAREESGGPVEEVPLADLTNDALAFSRERLLAAGIEIKTEDAPASANRKIIAPRNMALEVVLEVLSNAYNAVTEGKQTGGSAWIKIQPEDSGQFVDLRISNSGQVIPEKIRSKIFVPFFTTKDVGKGTGLGLSLCASNMHRMGGEIFLDPAAEFTTFVIRFRRPVPALSRHISLAAS